MSTKHAVQARARLPLRLCWLHARARGIPSAAAALVLIAVAAWAASYVLAHPDLAYPDTFQPDGRVPVIVGAALLAILLLSGGLAGHDRSLEQTTPTQWRRWRTAHVMGIAVVAGVLLAITVIPAATTFGAAAMVRNVIGYTGLTALSATVLGAPLAWAPPLVFTATVYLAAPSQATGAALWWAWPMQPRGWDASWICAGLIFLIGAAAYIRYGSGAGIP